MYTVDWDDGDCRDKAGLWMAWICHIIIFMKTFLKWWVFDVFWWDNFCE